MDTTGSSLTYAQFTEKLYNLINTFNVAGMTSFIEEHAGSFGAKGCTVAAQLCELVLGDDAPEWNLTGEQRSKLTSLKETYRAEAEKLSSPVTRRITELFSQAEAELQQEEKSGALKL